MELYIKTTRVLFIFKKVQIANLTSGFFFNTLLRVCISEILHNIKHLKNTKYGTLRIHSILQSHFWNAVISATNSCHFHRALEESQNKRLPFLHLQNKGLSFASHFSIRTNREHTTTKGLSRTCPCQALGQEAQWVSPSEGRVTLRERQATESGHFYVLVCKVPFSFKAFKSLVRIPKHRRAL